MGFLRFSIVSSCFIFQQQVQAHGAWMRSGENKAILIRNIMKIKLTSVMVDDQDKALKFYTEVLGFIKKNDMPLGEYKW
ncbi:MAG: VOC family protein, partial [Chitinophagaceae bacterium]